MSLGYTSTGLILFLYSFLAHLAEGHESLWYGAASVVRPASTFSFKRLLLKTTGPISTKLGRKHAWGMGIQICSNKEAGPFLGPIMGKVRKMLINLEKSSSHEPPAGMH